MRRCLCFFFGVVSSEITPLPLFYKFLYGQAMCSHAALMFSPRTASTYDPIMYEIHTSKNWQTYHISHLCQYSWHGAVLVLHPSRSMRSVNQWRTPRALAVWEGLRCMTRVVVWDMKQRTLVIPSRTIWRRIDSPSLILPKWLWPFSCTHLNNNI